MMKELLFVGQERSKLAQERGVYWEDEAQCANQLFRALRANKINPQKCSFVNLFTDESDGKPIGMKTINKKGLNKIQEWNGQIIGMGNIVSSKLASFKIPHIQIVHPSARGKIRAKALYIQHIRERLGKVLKKGLTSQKK
jgi:hypothetical protein